MRTWPKMARLALDRSVEIKNDAVYVYDSDAVRLGRTVRRSRVGYLAPYTVTMDLLSDHVARRTLVEGLTLVEFYERPEDAAEDGCNVLRALHNERRVSRTTTAEAQAFVSERVHRVARQAPDLWPEVSTRISALGSLVCESNLWRIGAWHGDLTLTNVIRTTGGRIVTIDHSPAEYGPQQYDYAKLRRSMLLSDELIRRCSVTERDRRNPWLLLVVVGMIGSHGAPELMDLFRELTS